MVEMGKVLYKLQSEESGQENKSDICRSRHVEPGHIIHRIDLRMHQIH